MVDSWLHGLPIWSNIYTNIIGDGLSMSWNGPLWGKNKLGDELKYLEWNLVAIRGLQIVPSTCCL